MEWSEKLATGISTIDSQHKELFRRINNLVIAIKQQRCKSEIDDTIKFLDDYARIHFAEEEKHMRETNYTGLDQQREDHRHYLAALAELKQQAALPRVRGSSYDLSATTNQVVVDWIVGHIMRLDMKFGEYLKQQGKNY
ncbi:MAG TPA: bacteriohemerythrin [Nitrospira sp.]|nr:bacteriohemerythrin [Nitrospirota bacterium]